MTDAVIWTLLGDIQTGLRALTFAAEGADTVKTMKDSSIVIRKMPGRENWFERWFQTEETPGILISPVSVDRPPEAGTNVRDDAIYTIAIEIIDKDNKQKQTNMRTYLKWQEQIARYLHTQTRANVQTYSQGQVCVLWTVQTNHANEALWKSHGMMVGAVVVKAKIRETRG